MKQENKKKDTNIKLRFILTLVQRSLFSFRRHNASLVISLLGVTVGVCSLVAITGVMNGMQGRLIDQLIAVESYDFQGNELYEAKEEIIATLEKDDAISLVVPFSDEFAFFQTDVTSVVVHLRLLDGKKLDQDIDFLETLSLSVNTDKENRFLAPSPDESGEKIYPVMIGWNLSGRLGVEKGDVINALLPSAGRGFIPKKVKLFISDIYYTNSDYDTQWSFMRLEDYREISDIPLEYVNYGIRLASSKNVIKTLEMSLNEVHSWQEKNNAFFIALRSEKVILLLLSAVIFCIIILHFRFALLRRINNKKDDIIALRTLGAYPMDMVRWFLGETIAVGVIGSLLGVGSGLFLIYGFDTMSLILFQYTGMSFDFGNSGGIISRGEIIGILAFTWIAMLWSSWSVVKRSTKFAPMQVLRYE